MVLIPSNAMPCARLVSFCFYTSRKYQQENRRRKIEKFDCLCFGFLLSPSFTLPLLFFSPKYSAHRDLERVEVAAL
jgi:hypothetical protein